MARNTGAGARRAAVNQEIAGAESIRMDASAVQSGGERGSTKAYSGIHPSLESATQPLEDAGLAKGTITTNSGLQIEVSRQNKRQDLGYQPQAPELGSRGKSPSIKRGVSQRYSQRIGHEHGEEKAAELTAEADALASRPTPVHSASADLIGGLTALHSPSPGPSRADHPGGISRLAKASPEALRTWLRGNKSPEAQAIRGHAKAAQSTHPRDIALAALGYTPDVQQQMFTATRDRIARTAQGAGLGSADLYARAHGQLQEHLDEALHGTRDVGHERREVADLLGSATDALGGGGFGIETAAGGDTTHRTAPARPARGRGRGPGLGMTPARSTEQTVQRQVARDLVRNANWQGLRDSDALTQASEQVTKSLTTRQAARRARSVPPEERHTMSPGADVEARARSEAQPVFSTGTAEAPRDARVGVPSEVAAGTRGAAARIRPAEAREGAVSPVPSNLPAGPVRVGRTRTERGARGSTAPWATPESGVTVDYGADIAAYQAGRSTVTPKSAGKPKKPKKGEK